MSGEAIFFRPRVANVQDILHIYALRDFSSDHCVIFAYTYVYVHASRNEANETEWNEWKIVYDVV